MTRRASPTLIGGFFVGGLLLLLLAVILTGGGKLFARKDRAVMFFSGSTYGLNVGAPVVFRGVQLGTVESIGLVYDAAQDSFSIPVVAQLDPDVVRSLGPETDNRRRPDLPALVQRGLQARLAMQSLLTGQLYVDLDIKSGQVNGARVAQTSAAPAASAPHPRPAGGLVEIPTSPTAIQALKNQFEGMDFRKLAEDLSAIAGSARAVVAGPELKQALGDVVEITRQVRHITAELDQRIGPVAQAAQGTLAQTQQTMGRLGTAADQVNTTAARLGQTADRVSALVASDSPLVQNVQRTADELARTAAALRAHASDDNGVVQHMDQALQDVSRAARALRELADLLDQQPQALLRGRKRTEPADAPPPEASR